jgi:hypothetical protein
MAAKSGAYRARPGSIFFPGGVGAVAAGPVVGDRQSRAVPQDDGVVVDGRDPIRIRPHELVEREPQLWRRRAVLVCG